ncbi:MAG: Hsp20/alpha crystallin family protein [Ruminiclostridium sp.]|nr:Hsp20/alpha crystallin family protein [Ruminiclostridium sp.]
MLLPTIFNDGLFDDFMDMSFPTFGDFGDIDRKLYGKKASHIMKTDVHEHDDHFEADIDLPGFKKEQIKLKLENGYLTVSTEKGLDKDEKDKKGKLIRQERYSGSMSRSFYVGEDITQDEIKAKFDNGVLKIEIPKKEPKSKLPTSQYIAIS